MPRTSTRTLHFDPQLSHNAKGKHVRDSLSAVMRTGPNLWVAGDEHTSLERLRLQPDGSFGQHQRFPLHPLLDLPGGPDEEIDIEGLAWAGDYLWVIGSHGRKREQPKLPKPGQPPLDDAGQREQVKQLKKVEPVPNRYLLARIPLLPDAATGDYVLTRAGISPQGTKPQAARLPMHAEGNELMDLLAKDDHLERFIALPGKDNGFDIEGIAAAPDGRVFVGLRGPVLRGWAVVLELLPQPAEDKPDGHLRLAELPGSGKRYHKHLLDLDGMGLRELHTVDHHLYLLAGPTMDLDGRIAVYRWADALRPHTGHTIQQCAWLLDVPHQPGHDRAEGLTKLDDEHVLVVYDAPTTDRRPDSDDVLADVFALPV
ncbi:DUF3616 domain-containing protein [Hymenobacter jeollabukensis]|uniref:DUF3616 domain-containing protein n=1 Tax=Hymenobacter jeollabukensis TaxID=2025313 RepID=A0A5R8WTH2_9BACT|nr:DUF3616 domain-containing protein [Hymenobacter jeollabukensis]TLM94128.1 DUF3616 domain-containing protein [Hymenobacter jeollabukensis]